MKLLIFPLVILIGICFLSIGGLGTESVSGIQTVYVNGNPSEGWYDLNDHLVAYSNRTAVGEQGSINFAQGTAGTSGPWSMILTWTNTTGQYNLYDSTGAIMMQKDSATFNIMSPEGLIALVVLIGVGGGITMVALTFFGGSDISVAMVLKSTFFISIWSIFSLVAMNLLLEIPLFLGPLLYFSLTIMYALGIMGQIGGGGDL